MKTDNQNKTKIFVEDLEETLLRLHTWFRDLEEKNDQFKKAKKFLEKSGIKRYNEELKKEMDLYHQYIYYQGKLYGYLFVLGQLGSDVPKIIERLRGIMSPGPNMMMETKAHYSEVKGHFDCLFS